MTLEDAELLEWISEHTDHSLSLEARYWIALKAFRDRAKQLCKDVAAEREACAKIARDLRAHASQREHGDTVSAVAHEIELLILNRS